MKGALNLSHHWGSRRGETQREEKERELPRPTRMRVVGFVRTATTLGSLGVSMTT